METKPHGEALRKLKLLSLSRDGENIRSAAREEAEILWNLTAAMVETRGGLM